MHFMERKVLQFKKGNRGDRAFGVDGMERENKQTQDPSICLVKLSVVCQTIPVDFAAEREYRLFQGILDALKPLDGLPDSGSCPPDNYQFYGYIKGRKFFVEPIVLRDIRQFLSDYPAELKPLLDTCLEEYADLHPDLNCYSLDAAYYVYALEEFYLRNSRNPEDAA